MKVLCIGCKHVTNHNILFEKDQNYYEEDGGWWEQHNYQIVQCQGCDSISFRELYTDISLDQNSDYTGDDRYVETLFPKRSLHTLPIKNLLNTPLNIKRIYRESIDAYNNDLSILCCVGLRAIIEGICKDKGIQKGEITTSKGVKRISRDLDGKINGLVATGFLTSQNSEALHDLRFLGNEAVHELTGPSIHDLAIAIKIVEHLIDTIYEMQRKAIQLKSIVKKIKK
jgi:hypothetical protein